MSRIYIVLFIQTWSCLILQVERVRKFIVKEVDIVLFCYYINEDENM